MNDLTALEEACKDWRRRLEGIAQNEHWRHWRELPSMRTLIHLLHAALLDTPGDLLQEFEGVDEKLLRDCANRLTQEANAHAAFAPNASDSNVLLRTAILLRTLDMLLKEGGEAIVDEAPECWLDATGQVYLVPIPRNVIIEGGAKTGQSFERRGVLFHRIIPRRVGGSEILITMHPDLTLTGAPLERTLGAALFTGFSLRFRQTRPKHFLEAVSKRRRNEGGRLGSGLIPEGCDT